MTQRENRDTVETRAPQSLRTLKTQYGESLTSTEAEMPPGGAFQNRKPHFWVLKSQ